MSAPVGGSTMMLPLDVLAACYFYSALSSACGPQPHQALSTFYALDPVAKSPAPARAPPPRPPC